MHIVNIESFYHFILVFGFQWTIPEGHCILHNVSFYKIE